MLWYVDAGDDREWTAAYFMIELTDVEAQRYGKVGLLTLNVRTGGADYVGW